MQLDETHEIMLISNAGTLVRTRAHEVARVGRNTQGVTLIRLPDDEELVGVVTVESLEDDEDALEGAEGAEGMVPDAAADGEAGDGVAPTAE